MTLIHMTNHARYCVMYIILRGGQGRCDSDLYQ